MKKVLIVGARGLVSKLLQETLVRDPKIEFNVVTTDEFLASPGEVVGGEDRLAVDADLVVICGAEDATKAIVARLHPEQAALDISPTYRCDPNWEYGLPEIDACIQRQLRVANPGCMATAAILLIEPLLMMAHLRAWDELYLDAVVGCSAGGTKMIESAIAGILPKEQGGSFARSHLHVAEIKYVCGLEGDVILLPKVCNFYNGIRMQFMVPQSKRDALLDAYEMYYAGTNIIVDRSMPNKIVGNEWAGKMGACIRVYQHGNSCLVVCVMDNLGKGAVHSAYDNIKLMLG